MSLINQSQELLKKAHQKGITVASSCHGPWMLAEADIIKKTINKSKDTVIQAKDKKIKELKKRK